MYNKYKNLFIKSIMFISSYFPLYILLILLQFNDFYDIIAQLYINFNIDNVWKNIIPLVIFILLIVFILISLWSVVLLYHVPNANTCSINNLKRPDDKVMDYIFTYIVPILSFSLDNFTTIVVNIFLFALIWFLYIKLNLVFINPLWSLCGYIAYEYKDGYVITNMRFENIVRTKQDLQGAYIANGVFIAHKHDNRNIKKGTLS